jgi:hypothetical protein
VEGIFGKYLSRQARVFLVFFSRVRDKGRREGNRVVLPYAFKRGNLLKALGLFLDLKDADMVIVRNFFPVLENVLRQRDRYAFQVGFWESFPHSYRRYFEARMEKKARFRKTLEYRFRRRREKRLIQSADFLILVSETYRQTWRSDFTSDTFVLPLGVDFEELSGPEPKPPGPLRFIHIGTVDPLRRSDLIAEAFSGLRADFVLHFFTASDNPIVKKIKRLNDPRIRILSPLPREALFYQMQKYDLGIGLIPNNELFLVSSPTKTLEYYALGLPALLTHLPEYDTLFDGQCAFFADFTREGIQDALKKILATPRERLRTMGEKGQAVVREKRNYELLAGELHQFLKGMNLKATFAKLHA